MSIQQQIILRYRAPGHVRFAVPKVLCQPAAAEHLVTGLGQVEGVCRVDFYRRQGKLSIRYNVDAGDFQSLTAAFRNLVSQIENTLVLRPGNNRTMREIPPGEAGKDLSLGRITAIFKDKFVAEFFTDLLVLYLIKLHWHLITQHWLKRPWQYRSEWMAVLYLIFLLVRSKKPKS